MSKAHLFAALVFATGCASTRRAAAHLDPQVALREALTAHGGLAVPSTARSPIEGPIVLFGFEDRAPAPHGTYLDDRDSTPITEVYLIPNVGAHLGDLTADALRGAGATVLRAYDRATRDEGLRARGGHGLELILDRVELHRWVRDDATATLSEGEPVDVVGVDYRYRWSAADSQGDLQTATHRVVLRAGTGSLDLLATHIAAEVLAHAR